MSLYPRAPIPAPAHGRTEFEILKASHKFLREEENDSKQQQRGATWDDQLAEKYYDSLFREFAVCDLKHYKSGNFSLRWRTETEVLSGAGEKTCGNTRCTHHDPRYEDKRKRGRLTTLELPFAYEEHGESKNALVKTVLCEKCLGKMMWKRNKEKEKERAPADATLDAPAPVQVQQTGDVEEERGQVELGLESKSGRELAPASTTQKSGDSSMDARNRRRSSRSRSPRRRRDGDPQNYARRRSPTRR
ncbi:folate-sensitive fragile site protein Fra10Ac1-domain-containing protein [Mycena amicta]|nr:folate-sensitive fragile site protein Fra10Ac1-domain-containing protein [Mycena amicta]